MKTKLIYSNSASSLPSIPSRVNVGYPMDWRQSQDGNPLPKLNYCQRLFRRKNLERVVPIIKWLPMYNGRKAVADLIAGVTVGLTVLPQALAYATIAGLPPIYGLYSSFVGCFVYIFFGSTTQITIGPSAIQSVLTNKYTFGKPPEYAIFLSAVTAVVTSFMGVFRLGFIANFISRPVISGFTSGVSVTIIATQLKELLGLQSSKAGFLPTLRGLIENYSDVKANDAYMSLSCIGLLLVLKYLDFFLSPIIKGRPKVDKIVWFISTARSAMIVFACSIYCYVVDPVNEPDKRLFSLVGQIPPGIPSFKPPPTEIYDAATNTTHSFMEILEEESSAIIVLPLLGVIEHITIAKAFAGPHRLDCSQEMLCIGITNSISCFFSSYSISGSFSRTTVNAFSGVQSPMGGLYTGVMVLLALQFLTQYFYYIPRASLAAVITCSVIFMIDWDIILPLWRSKRMDMIPWVITFFVTILAGLEFGILVGLIISTLYLLYYVARPRVKVLEAETSRMGNKFILIVLDRSLTFPSVDYITYEVNKSVVRFGTKNTPAVIDCHHIQFTDFTAAEAMKNLVDALHEQGYHLIFYRLKPSLLRIMKGVMHDYAGHFIHCNTEVDLENLVEGNFKRVVTSKDKGDGQSIKLVLQSLMKTPEHPKRSRRGSVFE